MKSTCSAAGTRPRVENGVPRRVSPLLGSSHWSTGVARGWPSPTASRSQARSAVTRCAGVPGARGQEPTDFAMVSVRGRRTLPSWPIHASYSFHIHFISACQLCCKAFMQEMLFHSGICVIPKRQRCGPCTHHGALDGFTLLALEMRVSRQ